MCTWPGDNVQLSGAMEKKSPPADASAGSIGRCGVSVRTLSSVEASDHDRHPRESPQGDSAFAYGERDAV